MILRCDNELRDDLLPVAAQSHDQDMRSRFQIALDLDRCESGKFQAQGFSIWAEPAIVYAVAAGEAVERGVELGRQIFPLNPHRKDERWKIGRPSTCGRQC